MKTMSESGGPQVYRVGGVWAASCLLAMLFVLLYSHRTQESTGSDMIVRVPQQQQQLCLRFTDVPAVEQPVTRVCDAATVQGNCTSTRGHCAVFAFMESFNRTSATKAYVGRMLVCNDTAACGSSGADIGAACWCDNNFKNGTRLCERTLGGSVARFACY